MLVVLFLCSERLTMKNHQVLSEISAGSGDAALMINVSDWGSMGLRLVEDFADRLWLGDGCL